MSDDGGERDGGPVVSERPASEVRSAARAGVGLKAALVLLAVFLLGGAAGVAVGRTSAIRHFGRVMQGPPAEARARFRMEAMRRRLDLTDEQAAKVQAILAEADAERERLMASCGPGLEDLRKQTDARVREVLSEDQKKRLDALDARRGRHGRGPRSPGGFPPGPPPR